MFDARNLRATRTSLASAPRRAAPEGAGGFTGRREAREDEGVQLVYEQCYRPLVAHFTALTGSRAEAQDVVQDSFLVADLHRDDFAAAGAKQAWLRAVAMNLMRRRRRWSRLAGIVSPRCRSELSIDLAPGAPEEHVATVYALSRLSMPVRVAVVLSDIDGLSIAQIARELSIPEATVKGRLVRGRAELAGTSPFTTTPTGPLLAGFGRDTERLLDQPPFRVMINHRRRGRRRRSLTGAGAALVAAFVAAWVVATGSMGGVREARPGTSHAKAGTQLLVPSWTAEQIVGHPDAFVVTQLASRTLPSVVLTVWKRCAHPRPDRDCLGREAITVTDGAAHRLTALGAVTGSSQQPALGDDGLLREISPGQWYWAHRTPGPYLLSATMSQPAQLTVLDHPITHSFGVPGIECPDLVGLCTLNPNARTLQRLALPDVPDTRWATPTSTGCGLWGLAGAGGDLRLIIQQRDGSFASADIPGDRAPTGMAEGGRHCEIAYYQGIAENVEQLVVSPDQGKTWQIRQTPRPEVAGYLEQQPRLRELIAPHWTDLPTMPHPLKPPGRLNPL